MLFSMGASRTHPGFPAGILSTRADCNVSWQGPNVAAGFRTVANGSLRHFGLRTRAKRPRESNRATPSSVAGISGNCCRLQQEVAAWVLAMTVSAGRPAAGPELSFLWCRRGGGLTAALLLHYL